MSVYIEYVIVDNFVITYIIGRLSYRALKVQNSVIRNLISATIGTACAVMYPFMRVQFFVLLLVRVALLIVLSLILFYKKSKLPISIAVFLGITCLLGGVFFAIGYMVYGDATAALTLPIMEFPIGILLGLAMAVQIMLKGLITKFHKNRDARASIYKVEVEALGKKMILTGFCDTGNRIFDDQSGLPVAILCLKECTNLLGAQGIIELMAGKSKAKSMQYMPFGTKQKTLWLIKPDRFRLYFDKDKNIDIDIMLGLSLHSFGDAADYQILFGPAVLQNT